ncbi:MAG TPA: ribonuclease Z [Flavobacterium sp.]|jgi:uncharacterized protein YkvS
MKKIIKGNTAIIEAATGNLSEFIAELCCEAATCADKNLIVDLTSFGKFASKDFAAFADLAKTQKKNKRSFVIIADTDYNKAKLIIVPTLQEAHDMIEMDEIERDLGF